MPFISFAQNGEAVVLQRAFALNPRGFYVDIGANHPVDDSVTKAFYDRGWSGINVEPGKIFHELRRARPRDINVQAAVSNQSGEMTFYEFEGALSGLSTASEDVAEQLSLSQSAPQKRSVKTLTLKELFENHRIDTIDFLKVDVEGHEEKVLRSNDWSVWRPRVLLIESNHYKDWDPFLESVGYEFALFDGINRFYFRKEEPGLKDALSVPAHVLDDYIPYRHVQAQLNRISALESILENVKATDLTPGAIQVGMRIARLLNRISKSFPVFSNLVKKLIPMT